MYKDIFVWVPDFKQIVRIAEGDGMNLTDEDIAAGYIDYIYYDQHELGVDMEIVDGGQVMLDRPFHELFNSMEDCIYRVLDMAYGIPTIQHIVLK